MIGQVQAAFDVEKVTKKFYDHFKREHTAFLKFLNGIPDEEMQRWYASVMLNRLMFIYFIQQKDFLDSDIDYLPNKLTESQKKGTNRYYKEFLCPLFFEGFAKPEAERSREMKHLLGKIPTSTVASFKNTKSRHSTAKTLRFWTRHLSSSSGSLSNTSGTLTNVRYGTITRLTPMYSATSLRNTSTRSRWGRTTPKRTSRTISAKIPSFRSSLTRREKRAKSPLKAMHPFGNSYKTTPTATSTMPSKRVSNWICQRKLLPESTMFPTAPTGTHSHLINTPYPREIWRETVARQQRCKNRPIETRKRRSKRH